MPEGGENAARAFYSNLLGLDEIPKPKALRGRGGVWFSLGKTQVHLGVERPFLPASKAHPAFEVRDLSEILETLSDAGVMVRPDTNLPGYRRAYLSDPFGNRIELLAPVGG